MYKDTVLQFIGSHNNIPELYKPLIFICIGVWEWAIVVAILKWQHININTLIHATSTKSTRIKPLVIYALYMTAIILFHILVLESSRYFKQHYSQFGPVIFCYLCIVSVTLIGPCQQNCRRFLLCLHRLFFKFRSAHIYLSDIIVADILISFSVVFTGIFTHLIQDTHISHSVLIPFISSVPYLIRLKQCLNEYANSNFSNKRQLLNAFKYTSTLPVIFLSHHTNVNHSLANTSVHNNIEWRLWIVLNLFSNIFAFGWDITMDWGLLKIEQDHLLLRKDIHFSDPIWYMLAVSVNGCFRVLKVGSQLYHVHPFCIDSAEIFRRWIWVIFRFEYEFIKHHYIDTEKRIGLL